MDGMRLAEIVRESANVEFDSSYASGCRPPWVECLYRVLMDLACRIEKEQEEADRAVADLTAACDSVAERERVEFQKSDHEHATVIKQRDEALQQVAGLTAEVDRLRDIVRNKHEVETELLRMRRENAALQTEIKVLLERHENARRAIDGQ